MASENFLRQWPVLCSPPSPLRELCVLDEDSALYCMEGDRDVYEMRVSELKESSQENPGKLFCKVPYLGIPLLVGGGRAGRLVVVVPTDLNENAEKIEEWVTAVDSLSQASIPAPVKGRWNTAAALKDSIYLLDNETLELLIVPTQNILVLPPHRTTVHTTKKLRAHIDSLDLGPNLKIAGGWHGDLMFYDQRGMYQVCFSSDTKIELNAPSTDLSDDLEVTAVVPWVGERGSACGLFAGTSSGVVFSLGWKVSTRCWKSETEAESDSKISAMVFMPCGTLLFCQGNQLKMREGKPGDDLVFFSGDVPRLSPAVSTMRRLVLEGGEGADIELFVKTDEDAGGVQEDSEGICEKPRECIDSRSVHGMKLMLSSCDFFRSAFKGPFTESKKTTFPIPDTTFEALRCVILFLHTDMVELEESCALDVAALARFLGLSWLQRQAERYATQRISVTTCASLLLSAEQQSLTELRKQCIIFAAKNTKEVHKAPEFRNLSKETMFEIFQAQAL